jgi:hypothetical protein
LSVHVRTTPEPDIAAASPVGAAGAVCFTSKLRFLLATVETLSVTVMPTVKVADVPVDTTLFSVPLMTPVAGLIVNPLGSPVADHVRAPVPPVAATVVLYAAFTAPFGRLVVVITGTGAGFTTTTYAALAEVAPVLAAVTLKL